MNQSLAITAIGADRPGIVDELTEVLLNADLNIEDSRMSVLGGEFAIILLVTGSETSVNNICNSKDSLESSLKLNLLIKPTTAIETADATRYNIQVEGMDNPGIVHRLARYLSQQHINIVNMQTDSIRAAHTGSPMFNVNMQVDIPANKDIEQIKREFSNECDDLNMDVEFTAI